MRAALILVGLSTLAVMEFETPPRTTKPVSEAPVQAAAVSYDTLTTDTLTTADRLEVPHMLGTPPQPISSGEVAPSTDPISRAAQEPSKIVEQHKRRTREEKSAVVRPKARPEPGTSKAAAKLDRAKPVAEVKPCPSDVLDGLFRALNLPARCQT